MTRTTRALIIAVFVFSLFQFLFLAFELPNYRQVLISAGSVGAVCVGRRITINDHLSGNEYHFNIRRVKRTEKDRTVKTAVQTPTIRIYIIPGGLKIISNGTVYEITPKAGRCGEWLRRSQMKNS